MNKLRINQVKQIAYTALPLATLLLSACKSEEKKPLNIIYIMTDDHSYQTISAYDDRFIQTPNLDRLAQEGLLFENSFVTNSISGPSRACLLTGKFSHKNKFETNTDSFDGSQQTFPKLLQQAGYQTAIVGKWHLKSDPTGFDYWNILFGQGQYYNPDFNEMGNKKKIEGYSTNITTDIATNWLENRQKDKPFCLLLHHKAPHRTWMPDTAHLSMFKDKIYPVPDNFFDNYSGRRAASEQKMSISKDMDLVYDLKLNDPKDDFGSPELLAKSARAMFDRMNPEQRAVWDKHYAKILDDYKTSKLTGQELDLWKYQHYMRDYLACIQSLDENIGRLMTYLEEHNLLDNTLIIYTSDQGFYMGEHGWFDKRFMYEESLRTPLLVRLPKSFNKRGVVTQMIQNIDHAPTFLDLAQVKVPEDIQGESYLSLLKDEKLSPWRKSIYYHYYEFPNEHMVKKHYGVRDERYKLIHFYDDIDEWEFYDLQTDPKEMHNLIQEPSMAQKINELKTELNRLRIKYDDQQ